MEALIKDEVDRIAADGPSEDELERARTTWTYKYVSGLERIGGFGGKADRLNESNTYAGDPGFFHTEFKRLADITVDELLRQIRCIRGDA